MDGNNTIQGIVLIAEKLAEFIVLEGIPE